MHVADKNGKSLPAFNGWAYAIFLTRYLNHKVAMGVRLCANHQEFGRTWQDKKALILLTVFKECCGMLDSRVFVSYYMAQMLKDIGTRPPEKILMIQILAGPLYPNSL